jgi:hypothetical protein
MNTMNKRLTINVTKVLAVMIAITIGFTIVPGFVPEVYSKSHGRGGAFLGGMVADHVVSGFVRRDKKRTRDMNRMERDDRRQPRAVQQAAPAPAAAPAPTAQNRLDQLNKLAAGGYITPQEYKAKKKSILDSM